MFESLSHLIGKDFSETKATDFEDIICELLDCEGKVERQVTVLNRGDGRRGRIDIVLDNGERIGIEIDRNSPRWKSIFKLRQFYCDRRFVFLRSPFTIIEF